MTALERRAVDRLIENATRANIEIPAEVLAARARLECGDASIFDRWRDLHPDIDVDELPACCYGVAVYGWHRCTCWEAVYDVEQTDPILPVADGSLRVRPRGRCSDCAYRRDSPERADSWLEEELIGLAVSTTPFWCHDSMRRPVKYVHPLLGDVPGIDADWRPPIVAGVPFKVDGTPGFLCAGWTQEVRRQERQGADT